MIKRRNYRPFLSKPPTEVNAEQATTNSRKTFRLKRLLTKC